MLLRGSRLAEGERWLAAGGDQLSADEQAFVEASVAARDRQEASARRQRRGMAIVAAALLLVLGFLVPRWVQRYRLRQPLMPEMVDIPAGEFEMGSPSDGPAAEDAWPHKSRRNIPSAWPGDSGSGNTRSRSRSTSGASTPASAHRRAATGASP